jgi:hypothetical protein
MKSLLADAILLVHFLFVTFVLGGQGCILVGAFRGWSWVRRRVFRLVHLIAIMIVTVQSWVGMVCPFTTWENALRKSAGEPTYSESFVSYWMSTLIYYNAPPWVFTTAYTLFGLLVLASWFFIKPNERRKPK